MRNCLRYVALHNKHWGPLASRTRNCEATICSELPTVSAANSKKLSSPARMSVNTGGASPRSERKPAAAAVDDVVKWEERYQRERENIQSAEASAETESTNDAQRETYEEKQSDTHLDFQTVKQAPPPSNQPWWYPDLLTGYYGPRTNYCSKKLSSRLMSVDTRGASPRSAKKPAAEEEGEQERYEGGRESIRSADLRAETSAKNANEVQRETYEEKQSDTHVDFQKVKDAPPPSNQPWWYPDPFTGYYVPRTNYGEISSNVVLKEGKNIPDERRVEVAKVSKKAPAPSPALRKLGGVRSREEKGGWQTSMDESMDLDDSHMRCLAPLQSTL